MSDWINIKDEQPRSGQNIIAIGTWHGEITGYGEDDYMGIGEWNGHSVSIDSDTYSTDIYNVTYWQPLPEYPLK